MDRSDTHRHRRRRPLRAAAAAMVGVVALGTLVLGPVEPAAAAWSGAGAGSGRVVARQLPAGPTPTGSVSGVDVTVSWSAVVFGGAPVGYRLSRDDATTGTAATLTSCTGVLTSTSCTETSVPPGSWRYRVTPVLAAWTGPTGPSSTTVTVVAGPAPVLTALDAYDDNVNGRLDRVVATFDRPLATYTPSTAPWTLTSPPSGATLSSVSVAGSTATLALTEGSGAPTTAIGSFRVALAADADGVRGTNWGLASFSATAPTDRAAPAPSGGITMRDNDVDGRVDRLVIGWSETLAAYTAGTTPWTLADVPSGGSLSSVSNSGTTTTVVLNEGAGALDTGVGSFTVAMASSATGIRDGAGNRSSFAATSPLDGAVPLPVSAATTITGSTAGRFEPGDRVEVTLSEPLGPSVGLPATVTVVLADPTGGGNDTITVPGLFSGARATGSNGYLSRNNRSAAWDSSSVTLSTDRRTVLVTLGPACTGTGCVDLRTVTTTPNLSALLDPVLVDVAGNAPTTTARNLGVRLF